MQRFALTCVLGLMLLAAGPVGADDYDKYVWETPRAKEIDRARTAPLVEELRREVGRVLEAGPLAPLRCAYADLPHEAYWLYVERGRIITTLAYAYPHLEAAQQLGVRQYVRKAFESKADAPWQPGIKGKTEGACRAWHGAAREEGQYVDAKSVPTLHVLYGVWLYADRVGDWDAIEPHWPGIRDYFKAEAGARPMLYGQMGAPIAVARLARRFGDTEAMNAARAMLAKELAVAADPDRIEPRLRQTRFAKFLVEQRNARSFAGQPFIFLDACPEVLRFVKDRAGDQAVARVRKIERTYPNWWLAQAPYFTRWTGDEGVGTPPELFGMCFSVERWIADTKPEKLASFVKSTPSGVGDCYWLEGLVQTIESFGQTTWEPVSDRP